MEGRKRQQKVYKRKLRRVKKGRIASKKKKKQKKTVKKWQSLKAQQQQKKKPKKPAQKQQQQRRKKQVRFLREAPPPSTPYSGPSDVAEAYRSEIALFNPPEVQTTITKGAWVDIYPMNSDLMAGPIEFNIIPNEDYLDLNDTILTIKVKVFKDHLKTPLGANDDVAFINMPLYSIFSNIDVFFNDVRVDGGDDMYGYHSILKHLMDYSANTLENQFLPTGYAKDQADKMDDKNNTGHVSRKVWNSGSAHLSGKLQSNIFQQPLYLLNGVRVLIRLFRQKPEFALMSYSVDVKPWFEISEARLSVRRINISPYVREMHEQALSHTNALYHYPLKMFHFFSIPKEERSVIKENLFNGMIPKFVTICMVPSSAFNGMYNKNPYNFTHNNVKSIGLYKNNEPTPFAPYEPNFETSQYMREYIGQYIAMGMLGKDVNLSFTNSEYPKGYTFFMFNLNPDLSMTSALPEKANLTLKMQFAKVLPEAVTIIMHVLFDGLIEIDANRIVYKTSIF